MLILAFFNKKELYFVRHIYLSNVPANASISVKLDIWMSGFLDFLIFEFLNIRIFECIYSNFKSVC